MSRHVAIACIFMSKLGAFVLSACTTGRPVMPRRFIDLSQTIEPGLVEKQLVPLIANTGYLPEPRFEDLVEDQLGGYSAMTVMTMLNHLGSHHDAPRSLVGAGRSHGGVRPRHRR